MTSLLIVCFHRVFDDTSVDERWPWLMRGSAMSAADFRLTLDFINQRYTWASEEDVVRILKDPTQNIEHSMCWVTFDDGYEDNLKIAAPILSSYGIKPTLFLTTGVLEHGFALPVDRWYSAILRARREDGEIDLGLGSFYWDPTAPSTRHRMVAGPEKAAFIRADQIEQDVWIRRLEEALMAHEDPLQPCPHTYLQRDDLHRLQSMGWRIGAHGLSHRILSGAPSDVLRRELCLPVEMLQSMDLLNSRFFAWPDGQADQQARDAAAEYLAPLGLLGGLSIEARNVHATDFRWFMPRLLVQSHTDPKFNSLMSF
jgi:peptidoglycan/xylan/chitin deacetylase (PgdA/CDA1 family)